jgi:hypothetical protein
MQRTYCNPLALPEFDAAQRGCVGPQSAADPAIIVHEGRWYLFVSAAQAWVSDDLVEWTYHRVDVPHDVIGPAIFQHEGSYYLAGNGATHLYLSRHPLGPWEDTGPIHEHDGSPAGWADLYFYRDRDGAVYCYHNSNKAVGRDGIFVTRLDPASGFRRGAGPTVNCFAYDPAHIWERWGDANEFADVAWLEAACVIRHGGKYHLSYSACGTEWRRYAVGVYSSDSPTGPWTYDQRSPILRGQGGLLTGTGHHDLTIGPDGQWWIIYHVLIAQNHKFDRRLALDRVSFDAQGRMVVHGPSQTPQLAPTVAATDQGRGDAGLIPLSINKPITASSHAPGRTPGYAVDDSVRTWWQAAEDRRPQWLMVDLLGRFSIEASRIIWSMADDQRGQFMPYRYRIELSDDKANWRTWIGRTSETVARSTSYDHTKAAAGRYVRLSIVEAPPTRPLGIIEWTVFGA